MVIKGVFNENIQVQDSVPLYLCKEVYLFSRCKRFLCHLSSLSLTEKQLINHHYSNKQRIIRVVISFMTLILGGLIYIGCRDKSLLMFNWFEQLGIIGEIDSFRGFVNSEGVYGWVKYSLPDGLWLFSYMFLIDTIWNDSKSLCSYIFIYALPLFALLSEMLQYWGIFPGVFDWIDVASYTFAIILYKTIILI